MCLGSTHHYAAHVVASLIHMETDVDKDLSETSVSGCRVLVTDTSKYVGLSSTKSGCRISPGRSSEVPLILCSLRVPLLSCRRTLHTTYLRALWRWTTMCQCSSDGDRVKERWEIWWSCHRNHGGRFIPLSLGLWSPFATLTLRSIAERATLANGLDSTIAIFSSSFQWS